MLFNRKKGMRSPIKEKPLRNPGESLEREINRLFEEELFPVVIFALFAVIFTVYEWFRWYTQSPPQPAFWSIFTLTLIAFLIYRVVRLRRIIPSLIQGVEGEKYVGQYLEDLRKDGSIIIHDLPGEGFNIDHVVISTRGIFVIETKTYSKPSDHDARITYDGKALLVDGRAPDRNPLDEGKAHANWLQNLLLKETGKTFPIRAVIVFPGWFVDPMPKQDKRPDVWFLSLRNALPTFIRNEPDKLKPEDVALANSRLSDFIRRRA